MREIGVGQDDLQFCIADLDKFHGMYPFSEMFPVSIISKTAEKGNPKKIGIAANMR